MTDEDLIRKYLLGVTCRSDCDCFPVLQMDDPVGEAAWQAALSIAIHKPHSLDKRVAGAVEVGRWEGELVAGPDPLTVQAVRETVRQGNCSQVLHDSLARQAAESGHGHCSRYG